MAIELFPADADTILHFLGSAKIVDIAKYDHGDKLVLAYRRLKEQYDKWEEA